MIIINNHTNSNHDDDNRSPRLQRPAPDARRGVRPLQVADDARGAVIFILFQITKPITRYVMAKPYGYKYITFINLISFRYAPLKFVRPLQVYIYIYIDIFICIHISCIHIHIL